MLSENGSLRSSKEFYVESDISGKYMRSMSVNFSNFANWCGALRFGEYSNAELKTIINHISAVEGVDEVKRLSGDDQLFNL